MSYSEAQKRDAYLEAQHILRLDRKWQQLMPGERKPNFKRAAREIVRRALGQKVRRNQAPLNVHSGLMHEHDAREAALIERTLKNGMYDPSLLHSFQLGSSARLRAQSRNRNRTPPQCRSRISKCTYTIMVRWRITRATLNREPA